MLSSLHWLPLTKEFVSENLDLDFMEHRTFCQPRYLESGPIPQTYEYSVKSSGCLSLVMAKSLVLELFLVKELVI